MEKSNNRSFVNTFSLVPGGNYAWQQRFRLGMPTQEMPRPASFFVVPQSYSLFPFSAFFAGPIALARNIVVEQQ
jgi:hypothetical protein